jgi:hypothetical protein
VSNQFYQRQRSARDKWATFDAWTKEHQAEQFTTEQLVEIAGFSYPTVLKYVSESPLLAKSKRVFGKSCSFPRETSR